MNALGAHPYLLVRARVHPGKLEDFRRWSQQTHIPRMLAVPGVERAYLVRQATKSASLLMIFVFESDAAIQKALSSPEATRLRNGWEEWAPYVRDVSIQIYTSLVARLAPVQRN